MKREKQIGVVLGLVTISIVGILHTMRDSINEQTVSIITQTTYRENFIEESQIIQDFGRDESVEFPYKFEVLRDEKRKGYGSVFVHKIENSEIVQVGEGNIELPCKESIKLEEEQQIVDVDLKTEIVHKVSSQDNLYNLSRKYYGDASKWSEIYEANREMIEDPDTLQVGVTLLIPDISI